MNGWNLVDKTEFFTFFVILEQKPWDECSYQKSDLQVVILLNEIIVAPVKR